MECDGREVCEDAYGGPTGACAAYPIGGVEVMRGGGGAFCLSNIESLALFMALRVFVQAVLTLSGYLCSWATISGVMVSRGRGGKPATGYWEDVYSLR